MISNLNAPGDRQSDVYPFNDPTIYDMPTPAAYDLRTEDQRRIEALEAVVKALVTVSEVDHKALDLRIGSLRDVVEYLAGHVERLERKP